MGKSQSIEEKMKSDEEFRIFMKGLEKEGEEKAQKILGKIDFTIKRHYEKNGWDHARLSGDAKSDYQNYDDWSLARVQGIIDSIGTALRGGDIPSKKVPGSDKADKTTIDETKKNLEGFDSDYSLIIDRVHALVSGVLTQFASSSRATQEASLKDMPLSGGLHLFFGSTGEVFTKNDFFTNQFIGAFQIVFEVYMSVDEARAVALKQILETTDIEIKMLNAMILNIRDAQGQELAKLLKEKKYTEYQSTSDTFNEMTMKLKENRDKLVKEYDRYKSVTDKVEQLLPHLDLSEFGIYNTDGSLLLSNFFSGWQLGVAKRYLQGQPTLSQA